MSAHVNFHGVESIRARTTGTTGAPLILDLTVGAIRDSATIFTNDQVLTDRLIAAINDTMKAYRDEREAAAVTAA